MSNAYLKAKEEKGSVDIREWSKRPGKRLPDGSMQYMTEQGHKKECDVNEIIKKYDKMGVITHVNKIEAKFGDFTVGQFQEMQNQILEATSMFNSLPSDIRKRFANDPGKLLDFMDDPNNREEAIKLGLIDKTWTEETDGLGEHIKNDNERKKKTPKEPSHVEE